MLQQQENEFTFNKAALESIVDCLVYCGKQGIGLRGHRDDSTANETVNQGNFKALLQMYATKDKVLKKFIDSCPAKNDAQYTSKTIQNELISIIGGIIHSKFVRYLSILQHHCR